MLLLILLFIGGIVTFSYTLAGVAGTADESVVWGTFVANFIFVLGLSQAGVAISAIMRICMADWAKYFSRFGEILTIAFMPLALVGYLAIYFGGMDSLFYWMADVPTYNGHVIDDLSPWLTRGEFACRLAITFVLFYGTTIAYFWIGRKEEKGVPCSYDREHVLNVLAGFVMFFFVIFNTNLAWEFGMMIIPHWESVVYPAQYWEANILAGLAFLLLSASYFVKKHAGLEINKEQLDEMAKTMLGFTLLWIYLFWAQQFVIWYGDLPHLTEPLFKQQRGEFKPFFWVMIFCMFIIPFFALMQKKIKYRAGSLFTVAVIVVTGLWVSRYLMVLPTFTDGEGALFMSFNSIGLLLAGLSGLLLSVMLFIKIFPGVSVQKDTPRCEDSTVIGMNPNATSHIADAREDEL